MRLRRAIERNEHHVILEIISLNESRLGSVAHPSFHKHEITETLLTKTENHPSLALIARSEGAFSCSSPWIHKRHLAHRYSFSSEDASPNIAEAYGRKRGSSVFERLPNRVSGISRKNPRMGGIHTENDGKRRGGGTARLVIADAWVALRSPPITHQSRALEIPREPEHGVLSEPRTRSSVTAGTPEYTRTRRDLYRERERGREGEAGATASTVRARVRACVRDSYYPPRCL